VVPNKQVIVSNLGNIVLAVIVIVALATDEVYRPQITVPILYIVPIAFAALRWQYRAVLLVVGVTIFICVVDQLRKAATMAEFSGYLDGILIVSFVAIVLALERERLREEIRHRQEIIENVERLRQPLTVILGYAQLLQTKLPNLGPALERAPTAIAQAACRMRDILAASLDHAEHPEA
jgi:signal transduction histidine kinase